MSLPSRLASASGAAAAAMAALVLAQRFEGTIALVALLVLIPSAAAHSMTSTPGGRFSFSGYAPVWALIAVAAGIRAGSGLIADVAGANAVGGLAIARGPLLTVAGMWLCVIAGTIAVGGLLPDADPAAPFVARRLAPAGFALQIWFMAALFAGPQIRSFTDAIPWAVFAGATGVWGWFGRGAARLPGAAVVATVLGAAGCLLTVVGGRP